MKRDAIGVPAMSREIAVDGVRLAVAREGRGPPLVCLHAIAHGGGDFEPLVARLRADFDIIRIDWPGHGRSSVDHEPASAERYADLLAGALEQLGVAKPIVLGNSIGGAAALIHAGRHQVRGLILCDPGGLVAIDRFVQRVCGLFARFFEAGERGAFWFAPAFVLYYRVVLPSKPAAAQRRRIVAAALEQAGVLRQAWQSFGRPAADLRAVAQKLDVPVWFAWAEGDRVIPLELCLPAIKAMKRASVSTFKGGHAAFLEQPEEFATALRRVVSDWNHAPAAHQAASA